MILSNVTLREALYRDGLVTPYIEDSPHMQPCSIDVHLEPNLRVHTGPYVDDSDPEWNDKYWKDVPFEEDSKGKFWFLHPNNLYLGVLHEYIWVPNTLCGDLRGVSSRARSGLVVHQQAGLLDPGWHGKATCEISVVKALKIRPYQPDGSLLRIGQVVFTQLTTAAYPVYSGRYQGDLEAAPAKSGN